MASNKDQGKKDFFVSARKKVSQGLTSAPVWAMQKAGRRIWNRKQKRSWKNAGFGKAYRKRLKKANWKGRGTKE